MGKLKTFFSRFSLSTVKRFFHNVNLAHKESGKNRFVLFVDMVYCMFTYWIGHMDYVTFGFAYIGKDKRKTFMTMDDNIALVRRLNDRSAYSLLDDKMLFNKTFRQYLGRTFIDLRDGIDGFRQFCTGKTCFFAKQLQSFGGLGVEKVRLEGQDIDALYARLMENKMYLAEEAIIQHPTMNLLCDKSVNTLRITTIVSDRGNANCVYALVRAGSGKNDVDNVTSGGMYTLLSADGTITHPMFCDKAMAYYTQHPLSGQPFIGFRIPFFREAVELCQQAALVEPKMRYIGWDVAITPAGPVLVEGNNLPGYDMCQNHRFHDDGCGLKAAFERAIND